MVENQKVLLENKNTLKNITVDLTKFVSTKTFSWCREGMGLVSMLKWNKVLNLMLMQRRQQVGEFQVMLYYLHDNRWSSQWSTGLTGRWKQQVNWVDRSMDRRIVDVSKRMEVFEIVKAYMRYWLVLWSNWWSTMIWLTSS